MKFEGNVRKHYIYATVMCFILFGYDAMTRFSLNHQASSQPFQTVLENAYTLPVLAESEMEGLDTAIASLSSRVENPPKEKDPNLDETYQANQSGALETVYAKDKQLRLRAIVTKEQVTYALVEIRHMVTRNTELKRFNDKDTIEGFTLSVESNKALRLQRGEQIITLLMYQTQSK